jgi:hypothetical protein
LRDYTKLGNFPKLRLHYYKSLWMTILLVSMRLGPQTEQIKKMKICLPSPSRRIKYSDGCFLYFFWIFAAVRFRVKVSPWSSCKVADWRWEYNLYLAFSYIIDPSLVNTYSAIMPPVLHRVHVSSWTLFSPITPITNLFCDYDFV